MGTGVAVGKHQRPFAGDYGCVYGCAILHIAICLRGLGWDWRGTFAGGH